MAIELISNLDTQLVLAPDGLAQLIEVFVLITDYLRVMVVNLLIGHVGLVDTLGRGFVAVRSEEILPIPIIFLVNLVLYCRRRRRVVHKPH